MDKAFTDSAVALAGIPIAMLLTLAFIYGTFWVVKRGFIIIENNTNATIGLQKTLETTSAAVTKHSDLLTGFGRELSVHAVRAERIEADVSVLKDDMKDVKSSMVTKQELQIIFTGGRKND